jgi:hypothetical protein
MNPYGLLLRLYPRDFREEYGEDMVQLLRNQLRDENARRVWARTVLDVALTAPSIRLEAHMSRGTSAPVVYGTATVASIVLAVVAGTTVGVSVVGLAGVLVFGALAFVAWRRARTLGSSPHADAHWWKYLAIGGVALAAVVVSANLADDEMSEGMWAVFFGGLLFSVGLIAAGLILGVTHAVHARRGRAPATGSS